MGNEPPTSPKDVADALDAVARRLRAAEDRASSNPPRYAPPRGLEVSVPAADMHEDDPQIGEVDILADETHITVTAQTRNVDAGSVHVSVAEGRLFIGAGENLRRDLVLPAAVNEDQAYATFRNGILDVVLPRRAPR